MIRDLIKDDKGKFLECYLFLKCDWSDEINSYRFRFFKTKKQVQYILTFFFKKDFKFHEFLFNFVKFTA